MDERVRIFIDKLSKELESIPADEAAEALNYYTEYLADAEEAGKDLEQVINSLGSPEKIVLHLKAEASMKKAQKNPGLRNFTAVLGNILKVATAPFAFIIIACFAIISFAVVAVFFAASAALLVSAVVAAAALIYEAFMIPVAYLSERIATSGLALFTGSLLFTAAYGMYVLAGLSVRLSLLMAGRIVRRPSAAAAPLPEDTLSGGHGHNGSFPGKRRRIRASRVFGAAALLSAAGLLIFALTGMPVKLFTIFNSMKPQDIAVRTASFKPEEVNKITVLTAHSHIVLKRSNGSEIKVTYEQPDWLDYDLKAKDGVLSFVEKSNGRLPLFRLVTMHESVTEVTVSLPGSFSPGAIELESTGGFIYTGGLAENINIKTYTGSIFIASKKAGDQINIKAATGSGVITLNGTPAGSPSQEGMRYSLDTNAKKTVNATTSRGSVSITAD